MRNAVITAALLVAAASTAAAQPAMTAPRNEPGQPAPQVKSGSTATLLAIGTTIGGFALSYAGARNGSDDVIAGGALMMLVGPSVGHFYAGETGHGVKMSLLRTGGALVLGIGLVAGMNTASGAACDGCEVQPHDHDDDNNTAKRMVWLGAGTLVVATLYDFWDAHRAAGRANEKAARTWTVGPSLMTGASGTTVPALTLGGSF